MFGVAGWQRRARGFASFSRLRLCGILVLAAGLIFFRLTRADVQTDAGHYSLRAVGYLDFLDSERQTTPFQWYASSTPPTWTKLSFHDHPPLVFAIQHGFFRLLGVSDFAALLPFALAGVASVLMVYLIGRALGGRLVGTTAATLQAVSTFATWSGRIGYLESVVTLFMLLAVWLLLTATRDPRWLPLAGIGLGLALMTKYSALVLVPTFLAFLVICHRARLADRRLGWAILATGVIVSPVFVYNLKLWQTRGHLDVQLSTLVPAASASATVDWPILFSGARHRLVVTNLRDLGRSLTRASSVPFTLVWLFGLGAMLVRLRRRPCSPGDVLVGLGLLSLLVFFALTAPGLRYLPIVVPWLVLSAALALPPVWAWFSSRPWPWRVGGALGVAVVLLAELGYNINTNHRRRAVGQPGIDYAAYRVEDNGFQRLQQFLHAKLAGNPTFSGAVRPPATFLEYRALRLRSGQDVVLYDDGLRWFSAFWYLRRYRLYHGLVAIQAHGDLQSAGIAATWPEVFTRAGIRTVYLVIGLRPDVYDPWAAPLGDKLASRQLARQVEEQIAAGVRGTVTTIANGRGEPAFKVYALPLKP